MATKLDDRPDQDYDNPDLGDLEQDAVDRKFDNIASNFDDETEHPLGEQEGKSGSKQGASDRVGKGFTRSTDKKTFQDVKKAHWNKRRVGILGGIAGGIVGGSLLGATTIGTLEFMQVANIVKDNSFSQHEEATNGRLGRMLRALRAGHAGETRVSYLGSRYNVRIVGKLKRIGITQKFTRGGVLKEIRISTTDKESPYKGMAAKDAAELFEHKHGVKPTIEGTDLVLKDIDSKKLFERSRSIRSVLEELKATRLTTFIRTRILAKFGFADFHLLRALDLKVNNTAAKALSYLKEKWNTRLGKIQPPVTVTTTGATELDADGNPKPLTEASKTAVTAGARDAATSKKVMAGLKVGTATAAAGGIAAAAGTACGLRAVQEHIGAVNYAQIIGPMMRIAMATLSIADQIKSGKDVDRAEVQYLSKNFAKVVQGVHQTWFDAKPVRNAVGEANGIDTYAKNGFKEQLKGQGVAWLKWTENAALDGVCSGAGEVITTGVSIGVGVISGGTVSTLASAAVGFVVSGPIIEGLGDLLAGDAVKIAVGAMDPAEWGSANMYGGMLAANVIALSNGGVALSHAQSSTNMRLAEAANQSEFRSQNFFARVFDPYDYRSLTGRLAINLSPSIATNTQQLFGSLLSMPGSLLAAPFNLYGGTAHAKAIPYDYPFPVYGFSQADLNNPIVEDPFENAETVAKLLDSNDENGIPDYIEKAQECFGVSISKDSDGYWGAVPVSDVNVYDPKNYDPIACGSTATSEIKSASTTSGVHTAAAESTATDQNWLRVRFFIFDTSVMDMYTCKEFNDATSCANNGITDGAAAATPLSTVDQNLVNQDSSSVPCAAGTRDVGVYDGWDNMQKIPVRLCALAGLPSSSGESNGQYGVKGGNGEALVNSRVSANFIQLVTAAKAAGVKLTASSTYRTMAHQTDLCNDPNYNDMVNKVGCRFGNDYTLVARPGDSNHQMGLAIDFDTYHVTGGSTTCNARATAKGDPMWEWLNNHAAAYGIRQYAKEAWHWDIVTNNTRCGGDGS